MHLVKCNNMYKRAEYQIIKSRLEEDRKFIQVVMGARQIGKSTVVKQVLKDIDIPFQFFSADNVPATNTAWISNCWAAVRSLKDNKGWDCAILVIDEIQKIANWSEAVKKEWDADTFNDNNTLTFLAYYSEQNLLFFTIIEISKFAVVDSCLFQPMNCHFIYPPF